MPYYPRPDAYETEGGFPYIPAQPPEGYWQPTDALRYLTRGALAGAGIHLFQRFLRRPLVSQSPLTPHLDIGLGQAGLSWYQLVQGRLQVRDVFLDLIKALEESSPFYLGRTFGLTELLSPYVIGRRGQLHIPYEVARTHHRYYATLTSRPGFALEERHYARGLLFLEGKLYGLPQEGEAIELLPYARLRLTHWAPPATPGLEHPALHGRLSPITQEILARRRHLPTSTLIPRSDPYPFHVVGAQSAWHHHLRELQSVFELWNRRFFRLLDDPLEFLMDLGVQAEGIPLLRQGALLLRRLGLSNRFGLGGDYRGNVLQQWLRWLRPEIIRSGQAVGRFRPGALLTFIGLPFAYRALDQYLRQAEWTQETPLAEGLGGLAANLYQNAMLARAHLGRLTGLQWLARAQEELAPGSTHLATLAAFPLAGGVAGGLLGFTLARTIAPASLQPLDVWQAIKLRQYSFQGQLARFFPGKYTLTGKYLRTGLALGLLPVIPFLPGALARTLGGLRTPKEWRAIFRGEEEVEVRTGRWWEMGASFFRGQKVGYYRPHWTVLARSDYLNRALFQGDEHWLFKAAKRTPILTDVVSPYYLERQHYYDRPYPVTGPSLPGLGVMGPIYTATLGRLFKPPAEMHVEGWRLPQGYRYQREEYAPVASLGGLPPKPPVSPYSLRRLGAEAWHRWTEAIGLPGWLLRSLSGSEDWGAQGFQLASAERLTSEEREYWDKQLGGLMGLTEWYRRINVRRRTAIAQQQYAPLRNRMPSWLPGPEYFIDFLHGDPYAKIPQGEARLPGPGYAALHPELKGVPSEEYPLLYRLRILTDVAPWAETTQMHWELATRARRLGLLQAREEQLYRTLEKRWRKLKRRREFHERRQWSEVHLFKRPFGRLWEKLSHRAEFLAPQESLLPLRPLAKFVHQRDPLEDYLLAQVLGADRAFWDRPIAHFLRPALDRFRFIIDPQRIPPQVQARRRIEAYFDRLRYLKARLHEAKAREAGDLEAARAWRQEQLRTMVGAEPVGTQEGLLAAMAALPRAERDYFPYFARETDPKRQEAILAAVPPDVGRIYRLLWSRQLLQRLRQVERQEGAEAAEKKTAQLQEVRRLLTQELATGGRLTPEALEEWQQEPEDQRLPLEEWLRLQDVVEGVEEFGLPAPESIFWDPRVDVEDAKLKFVLHEGLDMHDFELWASRERLLPRKPYLRSIVRELQRVDKPEEIRHQVYQMLSGQGIERLQITVLPGEGPNEVQLSYDGTMELGERLERLQYAQQRPVRRLPPPSIRRTRNRTRQRSERPL